MRSIGGYTYVSVLAVIVALAMSAQAARIPAESARIADREAELLFRGNAYRDAIRSYLAAGGLNRSYPSSLGQLLDDERVEDGRHIRRLYPDPITGGPWRLIRSSDGGIMGVASTSTATARRTWFRIADSDLAVDGATYADWEFVVPEDEGPGG